VTDLEVSIRILDYWRASLANDGRFGLGPDALNLAEAGSLEAAQYEAGQADAQVFHRLRETIAPSPGPETIGVVFCPLWLRAAVGDADLAPLWVPGRMDAQGRITPSGTSPWISRACLAPAGPDGAALGQAKAQDDYLADNPYQPGTWAGVVAWAAGLFKAVSGRELASFHRDGLVPAQPGRVRLLPLHDGAGIHGGLLAAYDAFRQPGRDMPGLLRAAASLRPRAIAPGRDLLDAAGRGAGIGSHLGQMLGDPPLGRSQREAIKHFLTLGDGEMLAVNAPPGTGPATLIQSVLATAVVQSAIRGGDPCLVVVSAPDPQALAQVVEALDAGGADPFATRWIPEIRGHAVCFPAARTRDFPCYDENSPTRIGGMGTGAGFFEAARAGWLAWANRWLGRQDGTDLRDTVAALRERIRMESQQLVQCQGVWAEARAALGRWPENGRTLSALEARLAVIESRLQAVLDGRAIWARNDADVFSAPEIRFGLQGWRETAEGPLAAYDDLREQWRDHADFQGVLESRLAAALERMRMWRRHLDARPWWQRAFGWIPRMRAEARRRHAWFMAEHGLDRWPPEAEAIGAGLLEDREAIQRELTANTRVLEKIILGQAQWFNDTRLALEGDRAATARSLAATASERLGLAELMAGHLALAQALGLDPERDPLDQEDHLDREVRHPLFWAAVHYWEGRWLLDRPGPSGRARKLEGLRWLARLAPCFAVTLDRLPWLFRDRSGILPEAIDLLILVEAGRIPPQLGGAAFGFARKALVLGDGAQMAPDRGVTKAMDRTCLERHGLAGPDPLPSGAAAATGSVLQVAQAASGFRKFPPLRGLFLAEQFQGSDELVAFCNELAYQGRLVPAAGRISERSRFPGHPAPYSWGWGFAHIPGRMVPGPGNLGKGNPMEAAAIANWVASRQDELRMIGRGPGESPIALKDAVAVFTPYRLQAGILADQFRRAGLPPDIPLGTVQALGATGRPLVIFSPVITKWDDAVPFLDQEDQGPALLNLAVSRAWMNFLVFGDLEMFEQRPEGSPSRMLLRYLRSDERNRLDGVELPEVASGPGGASVDRIQDLAGHGAALKHAFRIARSQLVIVSPWISIRTAEPDLPPLVQDAVGRGVAVTIYTDLQWNSDGQSGKPAALEAAAQLERAGARVVWVRGIHNKSMMVDDHTLIEGSFDWLSAARIQSESNNHSIASLRYCGEGIGPMIRAAMAGMEARSGMPKWNQAKADGRAR
jgi:hypothetical protein